MSRWQPGAGERLQRAALELFVEKGFPETTVPQIAERAGLTTRTYFRHFADKREVLFAFDHELPGIVAAVLAQAPASATPVEVIRNSLDTIANTQLRGQLEYLKRHRAIVESDVGLKEREGQKNAVLSDSIRLGFLERGEGELDATLLSHLALTVFTVSVGRWLDADGSRPLTEILHETLEAMQSLLC